MKYEYFIKYPTRGSLYQKKAFVRVFSIFEDHTAAGKKKFLFIRLFFMGDIFQFICDCEIHRYNCVYTKYAQSANIGRE